MKICVSPANGCNSPSFIADSRARSTVVPTAITRPPFARVVRTWQYAAYAERLPVDETFNALVGELQLRFGWVA